MAQKEVIDQGVRLRPVSPRLHVKQSGVALKPEARLNKLFELAKAVAGEGAVSWNQFDRSKSIHRFGLTPEKLWSWKALFQVPSNSIQKRFERPLG